MSDCRLRMNITNEIRQRIDRLIDGWCERRALKPLRFILRSYPRCSGLTDEWGALLESLKDIKGLCASELSSEEKRSWLSYSARLKTSCVAEPDELNASTFVQPAGAFFFAFLLRDHTASERWSAIPVAGLRKRRGPFGLPAAFYMNCRTAQNPRRLRLLRGFPLHPRADDRHDGPENQEHRGSQEQPAEPAGRFQVLRHQLQGHCFPGLGLQRLRE